MLGTTQETMKIVEKTKGGFKVVRVWDEATEGSAYWKAPKTLNQMKSETKKSYGIMAYPSRKPPYMLVKWN